MGLFGNLFGGGGVDLNGVTAAPGLDLGAGLHSGVGMTTTTPMMQLQPGMDWQKMLAMLQQAQAMGQQPQAMPMAPAPPPMLQAGGGQFTRQHIDPRAGRAGLLSGGM